MPTKTLLFHNHKEQLLLKMSFVIFRFRDNNSKLICATGKRCAGFDCLGEQRGYPVTIAFGKGAYWDQRQLKRSKDWIQPVYCPIKPQQMQF